MKQFIPSGSDFTSKRLASFMRLFFVLSPLLLNGCVVGQELWYEPPASADGVIKPNRYALSASGELLRYTTTKPSSEAIFVGRGVDCKPASIPCSRQGSPKYHMWLSPINIYLNKQGLYYGVIDGKTVSFDFISVDNNYDYGVVGYLGYGVVCPDAAIKCM